MAETDVDLSGEPGKAGTGQNATPQVKVLSVLVTTVVDGDTIYVSMGGQSEKVRFIGVNCPEISHPDLHIKEQPYGKEAAACTEKCLLGRTIYLEKDVQERDKYGRLLAYVWLDRPLNDSEAEVRAKMFNARLLLDGYAQVMTVPPDVKYADMFVKFQREAREKGKGLWGAQAVPKPAASTSTLYIGNASSKKYHRTDSQWAEKISPANRVYFKTREEAIKQRYVPW